VSSEGAPVDLAHLRRYTGGDPELERQALTLFVPDALAYLARIEAGEGRVPAHTLKGAAQAIGAWKLAALAERAEKGEKLGPELRAAIEEVRTFGEKEGIRHEDTKTRRV
jgi:HPt (histidine-containing phosphotransfer) domain-containing protein